MTLNIPCRSCANIYTVETPSLVNTQENPELKDAVTDGSFFISECPCCGTTNLRRAPLLYHDPHQKLMVWLIPEGSEEEAALDRFPVSELPRDYTLRLVRDAGSLIEKVKIFDCGLDDVTMELCKYLTKLDLSEKAGEGLLDAAFRFAGIEGPDQGLKFSYPFEGSIYAAEAGFSLYENCRAIISRNPAIKPKKGFVIVNEAWISSYLK